MGFETCFEDPENELLLSELNVIDKAAQRSVCDVWWCMCNSTPNNTAENGSFTETVTKLETLPDAFNDEVWETCLRPNGFLILTTVSHKWTT